jgi:hypothetical protein
MRCKDTELGTTRNSGTKRDRSAVNGVMKTCTIRPNCFRVRSLVLFGCVFRNRTRHACLFKRHWDRKITSPWSVTTFLSWSISRAAGLPSNRSWLHYTKSLPPNRDHCPTTFRGHITYAVETTITNGSKSDIYEGTKTNYSTRRKQPQLNYNFWRVQQLVLKFTLQRGGSP